MRRPVPSLDLVEPVCAGETWAIARLISRAEAGRGEARAAQARMHERSGRAHVVGITGVPGSGKSTLVAALTRHLRAQGGKVAVVAVDPSSPYSGGAILGDRIRMSEHGGDPGVFIRSMATRGATGGLARAALDAVDILDAAGFETIILETVGVGQDEVEIAKASTTTVVVSAPGLGDDVQAIKAGMLEIADVHVVSKCDRSDANRTVTDLKQMLSFARRAGNAPSWQVPVIGVAAIDDVGIDRLVAAVRGHRASLDAEAAAVRHRRICEFRLRKTAEDLLLDRFERAVGPRLAALADRLGRREADPWSLADELVTSLLPQDPR